MQPKAALLHLLYIMVVYEKALSFLGCSITFAVWGLHYLSPADTIASENGRGQNCFHRQIPPRPSWAKQL